MIALIIIIAVIVLIALLRFGIAAEYGEGGLFVTARVGFISLRILPAKVKAQKKDKKEKKPRKKKEKKEKKEKEPGKLSDYMAFIRPAMTSLNRLRRRLLIKRLVIHYIAAGDDAYKTAMSFGAVGGAFAIVSPMLESAFRVKKRDFKTSADFELKEPYIYVNAAISLAVWEAVYIVICLIPPLFKKKPQNNTVRKENEKYGEASDRRTDGSDNAEDTGNGGR